MGQISLSGMQLATESELMRLGIDPHDTTHSILKKWREQGFLEFADGDSDNWTPSNLIARELEYCMKNIYNKNVVTNWDQFLTENEKKLVYNTAWRNSLYYKSKQ